MNPIVLASASPRRRQLLEMLGLPFRVVLPDVDETYPAGEAPESYVVWEVDGKPVFSVQYHPEASPGPQDSHYLFRRFVDLIDGRRG